MPGTVCTIVLPVPVPTQEPQVGPWSIAELDCTGGNGPRCCAALYSCSQFFGQASKLLNSQSDQTRSVFRCQARSALCWNTPHFSPVVTNLHFMCTLFTRKQAAPVAVCATSSTAAMGIRYRRSPADQLAQGQSCSRFLLRELPPADSFNSSIGVVNNEAATALPSQRLECNAKSTALCKEDPVQGGPCARRTLCKENSAHSHINPNQAHTHSRERRLSTQARARSSIAHRTCISGRPASSRAIGQCTADGKSESKAACAAHPRHCTPPCKCCSLSLSGASLSQE